jgi:hypothetical protein
MDFLVQRSDVGEFRRALPWMVVVVLATFLVMTGGCAASGDRGRAPPSRGAHEHRPPGPLATSRGVIRDANGTVLAANRPSYNVYVTPGSSISKAHAAGRAVDGARRETRATLEA